MSDEGRFAGRRVLVTGASRGLGFEIARSFAGAGARVAVNARSLAAASHAAGEIGRGAIAAPGDVSTEDGASEAVSAALEKFGQLDVLVNNVGVTQVATIDALQPADWRRVVATNLDSVYYCSHFALPSFCRDEHDPGVVLNIGSVAGLAPWPGRAAYAASKAAVAMLTRVMAIELAPSIRVNAIAPGYIKTDFVGELERSGVIDTDKICRRTPMHRLAGTAEIAAAALYMCSRDASFVTGEVHVADGGWSAYGYL